MREGLGEVEGVHAEFPDVVPTADVEGRGSRLPRGAGVDVRELEGNVADAGTPVGDAELTGARGDVPAILAAHVRDARVDLRLAVYARALLRHLYRVHVLTLSFICLWVAEQDTAGNVGDARTKQRFESRMQATYPLASAKLTKIAEVPVNDEQPRSSAVTSGAKPNCGTCRI